jgi:hypothetical protein
MSLRPVLPVIVGLSLCIGSTHPVSPGATRIGHRLVIAVPMEQIDPGDRRPR